MYFHLFKTINHKIKTYCRKKNKLNKKEKQIIYDNGEKLKNCFRQNSSKDAINEFKQYLQNYTDIPTLLKDFIRKHIINHFQRYI